MFTVVENVIFREIIHATMDNKLESIRMRRNYPTLHHLLFVDDFILFVRVASRNMQNLRQILKDYTQALGQQINATKSSAYFF